MRLPLSVRILGPMAFAVIVLTSAVAADVNSYDTFYAFGDSLADNGNDYILSSVTGDEPAVPPSVTPHRTYFRGRFSNGYVAFEYLWQHISGAAPGTRKSLKPFLESPLLGSTGAVNFAFGGTGTPLIDQTPGGGYAPGLKGQIALLRTALYGRKPSRRALYAIVTGANDYRLDPFNEFMAPSDVVQNIVEGVTSLYRLGARDVMVLNLPDLGLAPINSGDPASASQISALHNHLLGVALSTLPNQLPQINLIQVDMNQALAQMPAGMNMTIPALETLPPATPPGVPWSLCLFINPATCADVPNFDVGEPFLFWDALHPTTAAHRSLGRYLYDQLRH